MEVLNTNFEKYISVFTMRHNKSIVQICGTKRIQIQNHSFFFVFFISFFRSFATIF